VYQISPARFEEAIPRGDIAEDQEAFTWSQCLADRMDNFLKVHGRIRYLTACAPLSAMRIICANCALR